MNGNPFYVPPVIPDMGDTILGIGKLGMERERMLEESKYRQGMMEQGQERNDISRQELNMKTPASQKPWDMSNVTKMKNQLRLKGFDPDKMPDVFEPLEAMAKDSSMMRGDIATAMEQGWDKDFKPRIINNLGAQSEALARKAAGMKEDDPARNKVLAEMKKLEDLQSSFAQINAEHVVPGFFSDIAEERANSRAEIAKFGSAAMPTIGNIQAGVITKFLDGEKLTPEETAIKDKYFRGDKDTYGDTKLRWTAKIDAFKGAIGREPTEDEKRRLFISDPYGILAPAETDDPVNSEIPTLSPPRPGVAKPAAKTKYTKTATDAQGNKVGWDGKQWVPIK